jgi:hypothetical protein
VEIDRVYVCTIQNKCHCDGLQSASIDVPVSANAGNMASTRHLFSCNCLERFSRCSAGCVCVLEAPAAQGSDGSARRIEKKGKQNDSAAKAREKNQVKETALTEQGERMGEERKPSSASGTADHQRTSASWCAG